MTKDAIGDRMKNYEGISSSKLTPKVPVVLRLDGKSFHSLCKGMVRPYDPTFAKAMQQTALFLCENIQGAFFGYTQSDEISIVLLDYRKYDTCQYFDGKIQKICSVAASMAAVTFNDLLRTEYPNKTGYFDCRAFNVPDHDVKNCILWRQQDATRNSIQMLGSTKYSHKELHKVNTNQIQDKLFLDHGINWNNLPTPQKRGTAIVRKVSGWEVDLEMPILTKDPDYLRLPKMHYGESNG